MILACSVNNFKVCQDLSFCHHHSNFYTTFNSPLTRCPTSFSRIYSGMSSWSSPPDLLPNWPDLVSVPQAVPQPSLASPACATTNLWASVRTLPTHTPTYRLPPTLYLTLPPRKIYTYIPRLDKESTCTPTQYSLST